LSAQRLAAAWHDDVVRRLSEDVDLLTIDLTAPQHHTEIRKLSISVLEDGIAIGVVQWINVISARAWCFPITQRNISGGGWLQILHTFPQPSRSVPGSQLDVMVGNDPHQPDRALGRRIRPRSGQYGVRPFRSSRRLKTQSEDRTRI